MKIHISLNLSLVIDGKRVSVDPEILRCGLTSVVESLDLSAYGVQDTDHEKMEKEALAEIRRQHKVRRAENSVDLPPVSPSYTQEELDQLTKIDRGSLLASIPVATPGSKKS